MMFEMFEKIFQNTKNRSGLFNSNPKYIDIFEMYMLNVLTDKQRNHSYI